MGTDVEKALSSFLANGFASLGPLLDPAECRILLNQIRSKSEFSPALFKGEDDFRANPNRRGINPGPGRNILDHLDTSFFEKNPALDKILTAILGKGYEVVNKKAVAAIPGVWIPKWVRKEIKRLPVPNLGAFVKPQYGNISYFYGIPYHQDLIDHQERSSDFITVYVYLDDVIGTDSPLYIIPGSHQFGATSFPHQLKCQTDTTQSERWTYSDLRGNEMDVQHEMLRGKSGSVYLWHACILHGTLPSRLSRFKKTNRISLRYIIAKKPGAEHCLIDEINMQITGPLVIKNMREALGAQGSDEDLVKQT